MLKIIVPDWWTNPKNGERYRDWHGATGFHNNHLIEFPEDALLIVRAFMVYGYSIDPASAADLWERYSNKLDAGWLQPLGDDKTIVDTINEHCFNGQLELPNSC